MSLGFVSRVRARPSLGFLETGFLWAVENSSAGLPKPWKIYRVASKFVCVDGNVLANVYQLAEWGNEQWCIAFTSFSHELLLGWPGLFLAASLRYLPQNPLWRAGLSSQMPLQQYEDHREPALSFIKVTAESIFPFQMGLSSSWKECFYLLLPLPSNRASHFLWL